MKRRALQGDVDGAVQVTEQFEPRLDEFVPLNPTCS